MFLFGGTWAPKSLHISGRQFNEKINKEKRNTKEMRTILFISKGRSKVVGYCYYCIVFFFFFFFFFKGVFE